MQISTKTSELRAELLGITPQEFEQLQKHMSFGEVVRRHGFLSEHAFLVALLGKLKAELHQKGWSRHRIDSYVSARSEHVS
ncbi:MAG: hypothetical protein ABJA64_03440 [Candidatus Saccharibacteria bacterium]